MQQPNKMPYIIKEEREQYDKIINELMLILPDSDSNDLDGHLNYFITSVIKRKYPLKYFQVNRAMGVLECIKQEFYRRVVAPYEDIKIKENGDVQ